MKAALWLLMTLAILGWGVSAGAAEPDFFRIAAAEARPLDQGDTSGCGPVSLLNLLKLGPPEYRQAFASLSGGKDDQALERLVARFCGEKTAADRARYTHDSGIDDPNLSKLCRLVSAEHQLQPIETLYTTRGKDESNRAFVERVHAPLRRSLAAGVPVIISIDSYAHQGGKWRKLTGHYMLATGVQSLSEANRDSFLLEYINPVGAERGQCLVYGSTRRESAAWAHLPEGDEWLAGNPYLYVAAPRLNLRESRQEEGVRHHYFLTILLGRLGLEE